MQPRHQSITLGGGGRRTHPSTAHTMTHLARDERASVNIHIHTHLPFDSFLERPATVLSVRPDRVIRKAPLSRPHQRKGMASMHGASLSKALTSRV